MNFSLKKISDFRFVSIIFKNSKCLKPFHFNCFSSWDPHNQIRLVRSFLRVELSSKMKPPRASLSQNEFGLGGWPPLQNNLFGKVGWFKFEGDMGDLEVGSDLKVKTTSPP